MRVFGELCLLGAFVGSGFAAFACIVGRQDGRRALRGAGVISALGSILALTVVMIVLAVALLQRDFRFAYVAHYASTTLPWQYALSALWVGQAGSLLLWAWLLAVVALVYWFWPRRQPDRLRGPTFGVLMAYLCFLVVIMVFAADPMAASIGQPQEGDGLSPLLQHPAMLIHPPIVFLGYTLWSVPFALAMAALVGGRIDKDWIRQARPWAVLAWSVLGIGILLGAEWAYEELGWGGYWAWDPVENGSLIPWLTGTALIHAMMSWQHRGMFKKASIGLAVATFALCNFATFLTRSGIFSSLHAFSKSPIGWLFLVLMCVLVAEATILIIWRRRELAPEKPLASIWSRESLIFISMIALLLMAATTILGTLSTAISGLVTGKTVMVGVAFYNNVLIPTGLVLLASTAVAPLLRWGKPPLPQQQRWLLFALRAGVAGSLAALLLGIRHWIELSVIGLAVLAVVALCGSVLIHTERQQPGTRWLGWVATLRDQRRQYAGFLLHLGFVCLAIGVAGSSLGKREQLFVMQEGETVTWAGREVRLASLVEREEPGKLIAAAELEINAAGRRVATLWPAQHFYKLQQQWTTEVAIHATWSGDFYTILHSRDSEGRARVTLVENPLMRWMWLGGWIIGVGTFVRLWPARRRAKAVPLIVTTPATGRDGGKPDDLAAAA